MKVSIIVPVYGVEQYLNACVESLVNQTFTDLEIILVDDGSPDKCPVLCDEWSNKDHRIVVIHKENGGLSSARNAALDIMTGEYVSFIDSDDWISPNWVETLVATITSTISDIAVGEICCVSAMKSVHIKNDVSNDVLSNPTQMKQYIIDSSLRSTVTNKLYRASAFKSIRFPVGKINEDAFLTHRLLGEAKKVAFAHGCFYFIRIRNGSITRQAFSQKNMDLLEAAEDLLSYYKTNFPQFEKLATAKYINELMYLINAIYIFSNKKKFSSQIKLLDKRLRERLSEYQASPGETYGYQISSDAKAYIEKRKFYAVKQKAKKVKIVLRHEAIRVLSLLKKKI